MKKYPPKLDSDYPLGCSCPKAVLEYIIKLGAVFLKES